MEASNVKAMREALESIYMDAQFICDYADEPGVVRNRANRIERTVNSALSKPPRNCDIYDSKCCRMAYHMYGDGLMTMQAFADWIFATAKKEGESDGK